MKIIAKLFAVIVGVILFFSAVGFVSGHTQMYMQKYFGLWEQNIETEIYKETEMYQEGKIQELARARLEYQRADSTGKKAVASMIRHRFADFESEYLPDELAQFLNKIRGYE